MARGALSCHLWLTLYCFCILLIAHHATCSYLSGVAPHDFQKGDALMVKVNDLTSVATQLPYPYYSLHYCRPNHIFDTAKSLGDVLRGYRTENSPYMFEMGKPQKCSVVCRLVLDAKEAKEFKEKIDDEYQVNMILDNLPLVRTIRMHEESSKVYYQHGFYVGFRGSYAGSKEDMHFINNHLKFVVKYHNDPVTEASRIVGFEVTPFSVNHEWNGRTHLTTCDRYPTIGPQVVEDKKDIIFTYDVEFEASDVKWESRRDTYVPEISDWFLVVNSLTVVLFLSGMVAMIMLRTVYRDISKYNQLATHKEAQEETGWKLVHSDVFRPPSNSDLLCVYVGTGVQFCGMILAIIIFASLGFLSPSDRGGLVTTMLLLWVFMGPFAGYASARVYTMFKGTEWKKITLKTALMFPATAFAVFFVLNALIWGKGSSGAVPFGTMFFLAFLWFSILVSLVFIGGYVGFRRPAIEDPVKTNKIPRQIPEQAWYMKPVFSILIGGILPFGAVLIDFFFMLTPIWMHQFYNIFSFLVIMFIILIITCAEITIVLCYFQLRGEDYLWWWRSFLTSGSSALYLFLYAVFYFCVKINITKPVSAVLYFGYMLLISYAFFVLTGTIGFYACFWFTRLIYSSVKFD